MLAVMVRVTFLGSSDAFHGGGRRHSAILVENGDAAISLDFGPTALLSLRVLGRSARSLGAVVLSHLHGDHAAGIPFLVLDGIYGERRAARLEVVGPLGTRARVEALLEATYEGIAWKPRPFELRVREIEPGGTLDVCGFGIEAFDADHMDPPHRPLTLRVKTPSGPIVAFSGDTRWCDGLVACARGADLAIAECTALAEPAGRHCTWEVWREHWHELGARRIVLTHLGADVRAAIPRLLAEVPGDAPLSFADDGLSIEL